MPVSIEGRADPALGLPKRLTKCQPRCQLGLGRKVGVDRIPFGCASARNCPMHVDIINDNDPDPENTRLPIGQIKTFQKLTAFDGGVP